VTWDYAPATAADADCHYGDHYWKDNGYCSNCGAFNAGLLSWKQVEKAEREGRACDDHFHRTLAAKAACKTPVKHPAPEDEAA
jgi:hypothetical protein